MRFQLFVEHRGSELDVAFDIDDDATAAQRLGDVIGKVQQKYLKKSAKTENAKSDHAKAGVASPAVPGGAK